VGSLHCAGGMWVPSCTTLKFDLLCVVVRTIGLGQMEVGGLGHRQVYRTAGQRSILGQQ
jgi:hypothetical protein